MQVPFRTSVECRPRCTSRFSSSSPRRAGFGPSYASRFSAGETRARAPRFSARSRRRRGEEGGRAGGGAIAVKLPSQRFKSNEMPVAPDRVCPIRSFTPLGASPNRAATPGRCRRSKRARPAPPRPPDTFRAGPHASKGVTQENPSRCRRGFVVFDQHCTLRK
jgi:hypothetical protein